ncbi:unnamed protein product [Caenorhabditis angaria]|uniref:CCDC93 N-terminal domain-containing protein n=1 Tax=Caenorhabditis angaria TaxID=860376 RepID=A0A9P1N036_9PELO|nr:unnamed protein product [Caenorhabditis angaria]
MIDQGTLNVAQFSVSYLLNYFAFMSQEFIQEPLMESESRLRGTIDPHAGYIGFTILWFTNASTCIFGGIIVEKLTAKWSMFLGICFYIIYQATFLHINPIGLYSTSVLMGLGATLLGIAQGKALTENSSDVTVERNTSLMWTIFKTALILGGVFLVIMFRHQTLSESIENGQYAILCYVFIGLNVFGAINVALSPKAVYHVEKEKETVCQTLTETFRVMCTMKMGYLILIFIYLGFSRSFWVAIYPTCIKFTSRLGGNTTQWLAISCIATGIGQVSASVILSLIGTRAKSVGRDVIYAIGIFIHLIVFIFVWLFFPYDAPLHTTENVSYFEPNKYVAILCSGFLGFGDAILQIQMQTFLVDGYSRSSSHAFALCKFFGGFSTTFTFFFSSWFTLPMHLSLNMIVAVISMIAAFIVQKKYFTNFKKENLAAIEIKIDDNGSTIKHLCANTATTKGTTHILGDDNLFYFLCGRTFERALSTFLPALLTTMNPQAEGETDESRQKSREALQLLHAAGYYRGRVESIPVFDRIIGGMVWCIQKCMIPLNVDVLYRENMSFRTRVPISEALSRALILMECPYRIEPHQILGLDYNFVYPVVQWLVKKSIEVDSNTQDNLKSFGSWFSAFAGSQVDEAKHEFKFLVRNIKKSGDVQRKFKRPENMSELEMEEDVKCTIREYTQNTPGSSKDDDDSDDDPLISSDDLEHLSRISTNRFHELLTEMNLTNSDRKTIEVIQMSAKINKKFEDLATETLNINLAGDNTRISDMMKSYVETKEKSKLFRDSLLFELEGIQNEIRMARMNLDEKGRPKKYDCNARDAIDELEKVKEERRKSARELSRLQFVLDEALTATIRSQYTTRQDERADDMNELNSETKQIMGQHNLAVDILNITTKVKNLNDQIEEILNDGSIDSKHQDLLFKMLNDAKSKLEDYHQKARMTQERLDGEKRIVEEKQLRFTQTHLEMEGRAEYLNKSESYINEEKK